MLEHNPNPNPVYVTIMYVQSIYVSCKLLLYQGSI